jgi:hypothetical protein
MFSPNNVFQLRELARCCVASPEDKVALCNV